jgi:archaellin
MSSLTVAFGPDVVCKSVRSVACYTLLLLNTSGFTSSVSSRTVLQTSRGCYAMLLLNTSGFTSSLSSRTVLQTVRGCYTMQTTAEVN